MKKFILLCLAVGILLPTSVVFGQEKTKVVASWKVAVERSDSIILSAAENHTLSLTQYKIVSESVKEGTPFGQLVEGTIYAVDDLVKGTGTSHGYNVLRYGDIVLLPKWSGEVKTSAPGVMTSEGTWTFVGGPFEGQGTYSAKFTSQTEAIIEWEGEYRNK